MTERTCRELGGFDPDIRHRTNDSVTSLALVGGGRAVALLPALVDPDPAMHPGIAVREIAGASVHRTIFMAIRAADEGRPSVQALQAAIRAAAGGLGAKLRGGT
jgi:DNA-binding transcriptional LysR family regulator